MKKSKTIIAGVISAFICGLCVLMYMGVVQQEADNARNDAIARYGGEQVEVLVAKRDINPGEVVDSSNTYKKLWVSDLLPEGSITNAADVYGKKLASFVAVGEVLIAKRFETTSIGIDVPEGLVALSVPAQDINAVGGAITKGSQVDVYAVGTSTACLGRNILVLATSNTDESTSTQKMNWITLAVQPSKVQEFVSAAENLEIYFTLPSSKNSSEQQNTSKDESSAASKEESKDKQNTTPQSNFASIPNEAFYVDPINTIEDEKNQLVA